MCKDRVLAYTSRGITQPIIQFAAATNVRGASLIITETHVGLEGLLNSSKVIRRFAQGFRWNPAPGPYEGTVLAAPFAGA